MTSASITLYVDVTDEQELWRHAYAKYEEGNGTADQSDFEEMCGTADAPNVPECLRMVFDPGESPPGVQINDSSAAIDPAF